ncbi:class I SAM-dependent methyltransferase [Saccharicrinis sp. FJH54]|uniref:class I SAM-dependent methyltransferase n=1 Tax=Saccharicrinis sp. FJH54 TaxID=3344665 RepID=UPI0035D4034D
MIDRCTICNSDDISEYKSIIGPYTESPYTLYKCNACQSFFFDEAEHNIDLASLYNFETKKHDSKFVVRKYWTDEVNYIIRTLESPKKNLKVLDVGCRTGDFLMHWDKNHELYGVELNEFNAGIAQERGLNIYCDFIENIEFDKKFDVITCYALLEHIARPVKLLEKLISILETDGILVILIPSIETKLVEKLQKRNLHWHMFTPPEHLSFYSRQFLDHFMVKHGMNLNKRKYTSGGLAGRYSKRSPYYEIFKNPDSERLASYYNATLDIKPKRIYIWQTKILTILERFLPNKYPYYDHMYSYYRKSSTNV